MLRFNASLCLEKKYGTRIFLFGVGKWGPVGGRDSSGPAEDLGTSQGGSSTRLQALLAFAPGPPPPLRPSAPSPLLFLAFAPPTLTCSSYVQTTDH